MAMCTKLELAAVDDVLGIVDLRAAGAAKLTLDHGKGPWSGISTEKGVLFEMRKAVRHPEPTLTRLMKWILRAQQFGYAADEGEALTGQE